MIPSGVKVFLASHPVDFRNYAATIIMRSRSRQWAHCRDSRHPSTPKNYVLCGAPHKRKGVEGLAVLAQDVLRQKPTGGAVFAFRGRRGDRLKRLYFDGQGFCLYYKILQRGRFPWPSAADGTARLTSAQLAMLWEGIDWRRPNWGAPPARVS
ncbi:IS66 family insertion sequence element accessory protein TnpB [Sinorhizobium meliloti]|uniref:IS66 family insertion sequence element accessory protein TnpB n=1 Tax=Rhizobium meliloti TaxID=382 RepID=UPI00398C8661